MVYSYLRRNACNVYGCVRKVSINNSYLSNLKSLILSMLPMKGYDVLCFVHQMICIRTSFKLSVCQIVLNGR